MSSAIHQILLGDRVIALHVKTESSTHYVTSNRVIALHVKPESSTRHGTLSRVMALHVKTESPPSSSLRISSAIENPWQE